MKTVFSIVNVTVSAPIAYLGRGGWTSRAFSRRWATSAGASAMLATIVAHDPSKAGKLAVEPREVGENISAE